MVWGSIKDVSLTPYYLLFLLTIVILCWLVVGKIPSKPIPCLLYADICPISINKKMLDTIQQFSYLRVFYLIHDVRDNHFLQLDAIRFVNPLGHYSVLLLTQVVNQSLHSLKYKKKHIASLLLYMGHVHGVALKVCPYSHNRLYSCLLPLPLSCPHYFCHNELGLTSIDNLIKLAFLLLWVLVWKNSNATVNQNVILDCLKNENCVKIHWLLDI